MKVICSGSRNHTNVDLIYHDLDMVDPDVVIVGDARGADRIVRDWCRNREKECIVYHADWENEGKAAGSIRNSRMLEQHPDADMLMAWPLENSVGTYHMIGICQKAGMVVFTGERALWTTPLGS